MPSPRRRVAVTQLIHLGSRRFPRKILERLGTRTLLDRGLDLLRSVRDECGVEVFVGVASSETELVDVVAHSGLSQIDIGPAAQGNTCDEIVAGWSDAMPGLCDWVFEANFICRPFLHLETVRRLMKSVRATGVPFVTVLEERGMLWDDDGRPLLGKGEVADSRHNPNYLRLAHLGYAHPADMWTVRDLAPAALPLLVSLSPLERIDIDTPEDLKLARLVNCGLYLSPSPAPEPVRPDGIHEVPPPYPRPGYAYDCIF
jgi:hypothetical protein